MIQIKSILTTLSLVFSICSLSISQASFSQSSEEPKVGLALSGGAAHGFAHLGVIKYLEEQNIPIDYITGTSMGAVVGGLYAMGYDYEDIYKIAQHQDWSHIISNTVPIRDVSAIEKQNHNKNPLYLIFDGRTMHLPKGVLGGQKMDLIISNLYCPAHFIDNYDELPIPFRCVAVNLVNGDIHQFDNGYLGKSIRASMAIPTVFPPVEIDDQLFVDGGLIRNFPVQENIDLGADVVIGSYVGTKVKTKDELVSLVDILRQSAGMANILDSREQAKLADVVISPETQDLSLFSFESYDEFINLGYEAAKKDSSFFRELKKQIGNRKQKVEKLRVPDRIQINKIVLHTNSEITKRLVKGKLGFKERNYVSLEQIEQGISDVFGTNYFSKVNYNFFKFQDGVGMEIVTEEAQPLRLAVNFNSYEYFNPSVILSSELRNVFGKHSSLNVFSRISSRPGLQGIYRYRFSNNPNFLIEAKTKLESVDLPLFLNRTLDRTYIHREIKHNLSLIKEFSKEAYASFGAYYKSQRLKPVFAKENDINRLKQRQTGTYLKFFYNSESSKVFPRSGVQFTADVSYNKNLEIDRESFQDQDFLQDIPDGNFGAISASFKYNYPLSRRVTFVNRVQAAYYTSDNLFDHFRIGGPFQEHHRFTGFYGMNDSEFIVNNHIYGALTIQMNILDMFYINPSFSYIYASDLNQLAFEEIDNISLYGYGVEFAANTPLGPVSFIFGNLSEDARLRTNFNFGFKHILD